MKQCIFLITAIFMCTIAYGENITINWGVDNQTYTTTSCEIGGNVVLPTTPTKRGHVFRGWVAEHFDRGTFANWKEVPTSITYKLYKTDKYGNSYPMENDTMIVNDATGYISTDFSKDAENIAFRKTKTTFGFDITIGENTTSHSYQEFLSKWVPLTDTEWISLNYVGGAPGYYYIMSEIPFFVDNLLIQPNVRYSILCTNDTDRTIHYVSKKQTGILPVFLQGTWKFIYHGNWETDGKNGWQPLEQIVSE